MTIGWVDPIRFVLDGEEARSENSKASSNEVSKRPLFQHWSAADAHLCSLNRSDSRWKRSPYLAVSYSSPPNGSSHRRKSAGNYGFATSEKSSLISSATG